MINRDGLPLDAKNNLERKLHVLEHRLKLKTKHEISKEHAEKLRKIFFIERTKVKRRLSKMRKKLNKLQAEAEGTDADLDADNTGGGGHDAVVVAKLEAELEEQQRVMDYVVNFPIKTEAYIPYLEESKLVPDWRKQRDTMMRRILREKKRRERVDETVDGFVAEEENEEGDEDEGEGEGEYEATKKEKSHKKRTKKRKHSTQGGGAASAAVAADAADSKRGRDSNERHSNEDQGSDAADGIAGDDFFA